MPLETTLDLVPDLPAEALRSRILGAHRLRDAGHRALAFYLHDMHRRGLHQLMGCVSAVQFAVKVLGLDRRTARELLAAGNALAELSRIDAAFAEGRLSWTKARLLSRVAVPETEAAWLERGEAVSCAELESLVAGSEVGRPPRKDRLGLPRVRLDVRLRLAPLAHEAWEKVRSAVSGDGERLLGDDEFVMALAERLSGGSPVQVVVQRCDECRSAAVVTEDGPVPIDAAAADAVECDARRLRRDESGNLVPDYKTSPALRRAVLARDGHRCLACGGTAALHAHHVEHRREGGPTAAANLATLCGRCHGLVHDELLRVEASEAGEMRFFDREGRPLAEARSSGVLLRIEAGGGAPAPLLTLAQAPERIDSAFFSRHRHLFRWNERRGGFDFREGTPVEPLPQAGGDEEFPLFLYDVVGAERAVETLSLAVTASLLTRRPVGHVLLTGPPGTGKTTLARALAGDLGTRPHVLLASLVRDPGLVIDRLASLARGDVLFIDEIHALPRAAAELLYGAMDGFELKLPVTDGVRSRILTLALEPFTLVAATTEPHEVPEPLRSRFTHAIDLEPYDADALEEIALDAATRAGLDMDGFAARVIARASLGTPRQAVNLVRVVHVAAIAEGRCDGVDAEFAAGALARAGFDERGLGPTHRRYLAILEERGSERPIGLGAIAVKLGLPEDAVRDTVEPPLVRLGLVERTPFGRAIARRRVARERHPASARAR